MEFKEFLNYIIGISTGCSGFVRSVGYVTHRPGLLILMDDQETVLISIVIPIIYDLPFTARIGDLYNCKDFEGNKEDFYKFIYFTGYNIKGDHSITYFSKYSNMRDKQLIYYEDDIKNIPNMKEYLSSSEINTIKVVSNGMCYFLPAGKGITNLNKNDKCNLSIYDHIYSKDNCNTAKYTMFKKKYNLYVDIWFSILKI